MAIFQVVGTDIKYNKELIPEGTKLELTAAEAKKLGGLVKQVEEKKEDKK